MGGSATQLATVEVQRKQVSGGGELDPGTIFVSLSNQPLVCADPTAILQCGGRWEVTLVIPPEFQSPGIYNLLGQDVRGVVPVVAPSLPSSCS